MQQKRHNGSRATLTPEYWLTVGAISTGGVNLLGPRKEGFMFSNRFKLGFYMGVNQEASSKLREG
jgi:hypothetical protein